MTMAQRRTRDAGTSGVGIDIEGVDLAYGENMVLRHISLAIAPGARARFAVAAKEILILPEPH